MWLVGAGVEELLEKLTLTDVGDNLAHNTIL